MRRNVFLSTRCYYFDLLFPSVSPVSFFFGQGGAFYFSINILRNSSREVSRDIATSCTIFSHFVFFYISTYFAEVLIVLRYYFNSFLSLLYSLPMDNILDARMVVCPLLHGKFLRSNVSIPAQSQRKNSSTRGLNDS